LRLALKFSYLALFPQLRKSYLNVWTIQKQPIFGLAHLRNMGIGGQGAWGKFQRFVCQPAGG
jgi:hypothetical protein